VQSDVAPTGDEATASMAELDTLEAEITVVEVPDLDPQIAACSIATTTRRGPGVGRRGPPPSDGSLGEEDGRRAHARYLLRSRAPGAASGLGRPRRRRPGWLGRPGPTVMAHHEVALAHEGEGCDRTDEGDRPRRSRPAR